MRWFLNSKIHKAIVTEANIEYIGSITIDNDLMDAAVAVNADDVTISLAKSEHTSPCFLGPIIKNGLIKTISSLKLLKKKLWWQYQR